MTFPDVADQSQPSPQTLRVLIVEDEGLVSMFLESLLDELGHSVVEAAATSEAALAAAAAHPCDLALVDVGLLGARDGIETAAMLRERFGIPAIFMSGSSDAALLERARQVAPLGFVNKPYTTADVEAALASAIRELKARG